MMRAMGVAVVSAMAALLLKKTQPQLSSVLSVAAAACLFLGLCLELADARQALLALTDAAGGTGTVGTALKLVGISLVGDFAARTCRELGSDTLAAQAELCGRLAICVTILPVLGDLLAIVTRLASGG
jgi:stage III sporulation protein AD